MSALDMQYPRCWSCGSTLTPPGTTCASCGSPQQVLASPPAAGWSAPPRKSPKVALVLSFFWLGAGHLYAGRTSAGVALMICIFCLYLIGFASGPAAFLMWLISVPFVLRSAWTAAKDANRELVGGP